jgi:omega-6 fatty acid desaturase (delta-12 desaturase)
MNILPPNPSSENLRATWQKMVAPYQHADMKRSLGQLANSLLPYLGLWVLMVFSLRVSYLLTMILAVPAAGFLVRLFIIFHDCGHGSFFKSRQVNRWVGFFLGVLTFTASESWWHDHAVHHATTGNLDKRGIGDVQTMTVEEYRRATPWQRLSYRVFRHPIVMFGIGPLISFMIVPRFVQAKAGRAERMSVIYTNLALLAIFGAMSLLIGWREYLLIQLPVMWLAGAGGIWMFYMQHQYERAYWVHAGQWDYAHAALDGASYYQLPRLLQWFSGNIGFHHIHHLSPRIPNYFLEKCFRENPELRAVPTLNLRTSLQSLALRLWDEQSQRMVSFRALKGRSS